MAGTKKTTLFGAAGILLIVILIMGTPSGINPLVESDFQISDLKSLESWVNDEENRVEGLKEIAKTEIIWADSSNKVQTDYSLVYIHGFTSTKLEGYPTYKEVGSALNMNVYIARLPRHGINSIDAYTTLHAEDMIICANEAIKIGKLLGKKVIVMATSTGATLALNEAARTEGIEALILYSPLIEFYDNRTAVLTYPFGRQMAKTILGSEYVESEPSDDPIVDEIWYRKYHIDGLVQLGLLVDATMKSSTFSRVKQPVFLGYYYKDEANQDNTVSVPAMLKMFEQLGTAPEFKQKIAYPNAGDHVIGSKYTSGSVDKLSADTQSFLEKVITR